MVSDMYDYAMWLQASVRVCVAHILSHLAPVVMAAPEGQLTPDWMVPENLEKRGMVVLVTLAALLSEGDAEAAYLRDPSTMSREEVRDALLDAVAHPVSDGPFGGRPRTRVLGVCKLVVAREEHSTVGRFHYHVAMKLSVECRFLPLKLALRRRANLASHWSTSHSMFWSALRYISTPSQSKPIIDATPLSWTSNGSVLNLFEESQQPFNAKALKRRREEKAMEPVVLAGQVTKGPKKVEVFRKLDFTALVIAERLDTESQVMAYVQTKGSASMQAFVNKSQRRIKEYIEDAMQWSKAQATAVAEVESDWALIERLARGSCGCSQHGCCEWWGAAEEFFERNRWTADVRQALAACLRKVIVEGPSKTARVPLIVGPTNACKSTLLEPIDAVFGFGNVLHKPKLGASCPLSKLPRGGKRFLFFDDYRPVEYAALPRDNPTISVTTFLAMFCGQPFDVQVSQSFNDGHPEVTWRRGVAMTAKDEDLWYPMGKVTREDIRHMQSRVVQFVATEQLAPEQFATTPKCAESWARWVVADSAAFAGRSMLRAPPRVRARHVPNLPILSAGATDESGDAATVA